MNSGFVLPFSTPNCHYLYDINTNCILKTNKNIFNYFKYGEKLTEDDHYIIELMIKDGFLKNNQIEKMHHGATDILQSLLKRNIPGITLQVTQNCNLRCRYCVYSGEYNNRTHTSKMMSEDMAKKGIDFVLKHSSDVQDVVFGFYGGEPLLNFNLIKKSVDYIKYIFEGKNTLFNITTNGTVFTDENLSFLQEHNFSILISLDGPREIHDHNRVFASTGKGTFDIIMNNLEKIKHDYPSLLQKISFNAVIDPTLPASCSNEFFYTNKELEGFNVQASPIVSEYKNEKLKFTESYIIGEEMELFKVYMSKLGRISSSRISQMTEHRFDGFKISLFTQRKKAVKLPKIYHHSGPCIPGVLKLFMNVDGKFFPCEKISENSKQTCIGHVDTGFNVKQIDKLLNLGKINEEECKKCWAIRTCQICLAYVDDGEELSFDKKMRSCANTRRNLGNSFLDFCVLTEHGYVFENGAFPIHVYGE